MKEGIHPDYHQGVTVSCSCGNSWITGSTKAEIRTDVCSKCHPFYTGEQRIIDTAGQVERFMKRLEQKQNMDTVSRQAETVRHAEESAVRRARARGDDVEEALAEARQNLESAALEEDAEISG